MALPLILLIMGLGLASDAQQAQAHRPVQGICQAGELQGDAAAIATRRAVIDITHAYRADLPRWQSSHGLGKLTGLVLSMAEGDFCNVSELKFEEVHSGTHVDAPGHYVQEYYEAGLDIASLSLDVLIGPVLLVDAPRHSNLTGSIPLGNNLEGTCATFCTQPRFYRIFIFPPGVERIIFRTLNSDRKLMWTKEWDSSYVGFTTDGADWLVKHTNVKFVGIDYLAVAAYVDIVAAHRILLGKKLVIVEGLNLDDVEMGLYTVHCLPLKLVQAEGSPIRCVLTT